MGSGRREAGKILLAHQTSAPPPKLKKLRKKEEAANATDRPKTIWINGRIIAQLRWCRGFHAITSVKPKLA